MNIDVLLVFTVISVVAIISLSLIIWLSRAESFQKISFIAFSITVSLFLLTLYFSNKVFTDSVNLIFNRGVFVVAPWMVFSIDRVVRSLINKNSKYTNKRLLLFIVILSVFAMTNYFIEGTYVKGTSLIPYPSLIVSDYLYYPFMIALVSPIFPLFYTLYKTSKSAVGFASQRARTLLLSTLSVFTLLVFSNIIIPSIGVNDSSVLAPIWMFIWAVSIYYSIANQRLFGIRNVIGKVFIYSIEGLLMFLLFGALKLVLDLTKSDISISTSVILVPVFILLSMLWPIVTTEIKNAVYFVFKVRTKETERYIDEFINILSKTVEAVDVFKESEKIFKEVFLVDKITFYLLSKEGKGIFLASKKAALSNKDAQYITKEMKDQYSIGKSELIITDEYLERKGKNKGITELLKKANIEILAPIFDRNKYLGTIIIQSREDGTSYSVEEVVFLNMIISNITIALGRSLLFDEIQEFNESLQEKIEMATQDLRQKNEALKKLRNRERDMMDIIGHELRTPLSIIKMTIGLMKMKMEKGLRFSLNDIKDYYNKILDATQREIRLLETMISSTKIDSGNLDLYLEKVNLFTITSDSILAQQLKLKEKKLKIHFDMKSKDNFVYADRIRLPEILDNFIGNAVKYTEKGDIWVTISDIENKGFLLVSIKDTGVGIPKEALPHLGTKFYRVRNYLDNGIKKNLLHIVRPGGTGLGLYVTYRLVKLMGGDVKVETEVDKGSTFSFTLPKYQGQKESGTQKKGSKNIFDQMGFTHQNQ